MEGSSDYEMCLTKKIELCKYLFKTWRLWVWNYNLLASIHLTTELLIKQNSLAYYDKICGVQELFVNPSQHDFLLSHLIA